jgi:hypothetical protein
MALTTSLRVSVRPDAIHRHEDCVRRLVGRARPDPDSFSWTAYQIVAGVVGAYFYGSEADDWASLTARESTDALTRRLFGEEEGSSLLEQMNNGVTGARLIVFRDRPDLSYFPEQVDQPPAFIIRTRIRACAGGQDACEELIRKVAETVPKVDDPRRFRTLQTLIGDLNEYSIVRTVSDPAHLDHERTVPDLLNEVFGAAEGGLLLRTGREAIESVQSDLALYRDDLSNPR